MRIRTVRTIFKKEMLDTLRDRRTLIFMLAIPIAAIPLLMILLSSLMIGQIEKMQKEKSDIVVQGMSNLPEELQTLLTETEKISIKTEADYQGKDLTEELKAGSFDALLIVPKSFDKAITIESQTELEIYYDKAEFSSKFAVDKLKDILTPYRDQIVASRLQQREISEDVIKPFEILSQNVAPMKKVAGEKLGGMLPYLIIIMCFMGAMYPAIDLAAGEKERGTLETLLVSPASRGEFVMGKYLVILTTGIVAALLSMGSLTFSLNYMVKDLMASATEMLEIQFDLTTVILVLMIVIPMSGIFAALLLSVSIFARSFKEAQSYITAMNMLIIMPAFVSFLPGIHLDYKMALIPIVNISMIIKDAIAGTIEWNYVIIAFVSTIVLAALTLFLAKKWFEKESVLFRM